MSETVQTFRTILEATGGNNVGIVVPDEVVSAFGRGKRVPVSVTVDGVYTYSTSITSMGGRFLASFNAATRAATGRGAGDEIEVRLEVDEAPRTVAVPDALQAALDSDPGANAAWKSLSYGGQAEGPRPVGLVRQDWPASTGPGRDNVEETHQRRLAEVLESLRA